MKILAIDDNQDNLTTLQVILADRLPDATILTALNGLEGIEIALMKDPDVILLDIVMRVMNGFEVCKKLKEEDRLRDIPVLFLTAQSTDRNSRLTAMEVGADGFLSKPFDEVELIVQIRAMAKIKAANRLRCMEKVQMAGLVQERTRELEHELAERKRAEKTLQALSSRLEAILAAVPDIIMEVDNNKVYTWANQGGLAFFGDDVVGKEAADYFEGEQPTYRVVQPLFDGQQELIYLESWQRRNDGTKRLLAWWCRVLRDERGDVTGALSSGRDITEIKRAEEELRESETKFRAMVERFPLAIHLSVGLEQRTQYVNSTMVKLFGYTMKDLPSVEQWWPLAYPDETYRRQISEEWNRRVKLAIETQSPIEPMEVVVTCRDGSKKHISWGYTTLGDSNYSYGLDLTERKHAQEERDISQRMLSSMINAITESAFLMTVDGIVQIANEAAAHRLGMHSGSICGKNMYDLIPPELALTHRMQIEQSIRSRKPVNFEDVLRGRHILNSIYPVMDAKGEVTQLAVFGYDITERAQAEEDKKEEQILLKTMIDSLPGAFYMLDENGCYVRWNAYQRDEIVGKPENQIFGTPAIGTIHPDDRELIGSKIESVLHGGSEIVAGRVLLRGGPDYRWLLMTGRQINFKGKLFLVGMGIDLTDQRKVENALRESEERFRNVFEHAAVGKSITNVNGQMKTNKAFCQILGYSSKELSATRWQDITHPDDVERDQKLIDRIVSGEISSMRWEKRYIHKNGHLIWVDISTFLQRDNDYQPRYFITTIFDITERRQEEQIRNAQTVLLNALINSPVDIIIFSLDRNYCYTAFNDRHRKEMKTVWGVDIEQGMNLLEIMTVPELCAAARISIDRALRGEGFSEVQHQPGLDIHYEFSWNPIRQGSDVTGVTVFIRDITERKVAEAALHRYTERLQNLHRIDQAILQSAASPETIAQSALLHIRGLLHCQCASVGIFDPKCKEVLVFVADVNNETVVKTGKILAEEEYGDLEILRQGVIEVVENMSTVTSPPAVVRILHLEGMNSSINVPLFSAQALYGALNIGWERPRTITPEEREIACEVAGQITLAIEQARLLQETKRHALELEQRVAERTGQLEAVNKELEAFAYSVSHDLRAPLRAVDGYIRILIEDYEPHLDAEGKRVCSVISESARDMGKLIDDLLSFSRIGRSAMKISPIDMTTLAKSMFFELTTSAERDRIDFNVHPLPTAVADPTLIRLVWMNLIGNAVKFSSKKERAMIAVRSDTQDGEVIYSIRDNGAGFDMQYVSKLFGVFQRLHSAKEFEGTGVGLAIVQRIILRHGGRVWAEGDVGHGAEFHFMIPRGCNDEARNMKDESSKRASSPSN